MVGLNFPLAPRPYIRIQEQIFYMPTSLGQYISIQMFVNRYQTRTCLKEISYVLKVNAYV